MPAIDYYFYGQSPFTLLGHAALQAVAKKHGASVNFRPVVLKDLWAESGAVMPAERPPVRQRYRLLELQRIAVKRGIQIALKPKHFPTDIVLADSCAAILAEDGEPWDYVEAVGRGVWVDEVDMADEAEIAKCLDAAGHDASSVIERAKSGEAADIIAANSRAAIEADAVGVPAYVLDGEVFWGQDRIEFLADALATGRPAFTSDV